MNQKAVVSAGILGVILTLVLGFFSVVPWQIVPVLVAVSIGVPGLILNYERGKPNTGRPRQAESEREAVEEIVDTPVPPTAEREMQKDKTEALSPKEEETQKIELPSGALLPNANEPVRLLIDDKLLDRIFEEARRKALEIYPDSQFTHLSILVSPFGVVGRSTVTIHMEFYSKWTEKLCLFQYSDFSMKLTHMLPDKRAKFEYERQMLADLPWKTSPQWMQFLSKAYDKIKPLPSAHGTGYLLSTGQQGCWRATFEDGLSGNEYWFEWNGKGLDEKSIVQTR